MAEEIIDVQNVEEETSGGATAPVVNIDLSGTEEALKKIANILSGDGDEKSLIKDIANILSGDEKSMVKDIAIKLYANSKFDEGKSAQQLANDAVERALILISKLPK